MNTCTHKHNNNMILENSMILCSGGEKKRKIKTTKIQLGDEREKKMFIVMTNWVFFWLVGWLVG